MPDTDESTAVSHAEEAELAVAAVPAIDQNASFGIDEGEVDQLEKKWITWSYDVEENKRLVLDEVDDVGATPQRMSVWNTDSPRGHFGGSRARRRTAWGDRVVSSSPVYYGWVVAGLVAVCALVVSPAQVYCVGAVVDMMIIDLGLTRLEIASVYATAALLSAPLITLLPLVLARMSRRLLISVCGAGVCAGLLLVSGAGGRVTLLLAWTLLLAVGPGMLYPAAEAVLLDWWQAKRAKVQVGVNALAGVFGMIALPALVTAAAACPDCDPAHDAASCSCWRGAYSALGALLALPVAALSALFIEGGASDHDLHLDNEEHAAGETSLIAAMIEDEARRRDDIEMMEPNAAAAAAAAANGGGGVLGADADDPGAAAAAGGNMAAAAALPVPARTSPRTKGGRRGRSLKEFWTLHDVLTHTTFWLAQLSVSSIQAIVAAFLFHRAHLASTHFAHHASRTLSAAASNTSVHGGGMGGIAPTEYAAQPADGLPIELLVGVAAVVCSPLSLLIQRKEYLVLIAIGLCAAGMLTLAGSSGTGTLQLVSVLLGAAFGVTNAYTSMLWEYFYGNSDVHRIKQISVAISTAASGVAIWLFAVEWHNRGSYHGALIGGGLLCLILGALDLTALAKPEALESVVRRAPTWEQLAAYRQRQKYFSTSHAAKQRAARLASHLRTRAAGRGSCASEVPAEGSTAWMNATLEPTNQANPIQRELAPTVETLAAEEQARAGGGA